MAQHQQLWPVSILCRVLVVSRGGLYGYVPRQSAPCIGAEDVALVTRVQAIAAETRSSDGSRRLAKPLQDDGSAVGRDKARRFMPQAAVTVRRPKPHHPVTPDSRHGYAVAPNVLARQFTVGQPNQVWVGDITDVWTAAGW
jgi:transposase InsO family protein